MRFSFLRFCFCLPMLLCTACGDGGPRRATEEDAAPAEPFEDRYPTDITPPKGTSYPCAVTALPKDLAGIPPSHRNYINHTYALLIEAVHHRLKVYNQLGSAQPSQAALDEYLAATRDIAARIRKQPTPATLEPFRADVAAALDKQMEFFTKAYEGLRAGKTFQDVIQLPEARDASSRLLSAWSKMQARYPAWSAAVKDSVYHHLCALDIF